MRFAFVLAMIGLALATITLAQHKPMNAGLPLVQSDYERCEIVRTGPIERSKLKPHFGRRPDQA